jgi:hypothetical protein
MLFHVESSSGRTRPVDSWHPRVRKWHIAVSRVSPSGGFTSSVTASNIPFHRRMGIPTVSHAPCRTQPGVLDWLATDRPAGRRPEAVAYLRSTRSTRPL